MAVVQIIGDTHCPGMRRGYLSFLRKVRDRHQPSRIVHIGDLADWCSIKYHEREPGVNDSVAEYKRAFQQIQSLAEEFPKADWLIGNHDALTVRQATSVGLPTAVLKDYRDIWNIKWRVHDRFAKLIIDDVAYAHGDSGRGGQDAALTQAKDNFRSTVIGHFHCQAGVKYWANKKTLIFGMAVGCGIDADALQFAYGRPHPSKPILGCGIVIDGERAIWEPWLLPKGRTK